VSAVGEGWVGVGGFGAGGIQGGGVQHVGKPFYTAAQPQYTLVLCVLSVLTHCHVTKLHLGGCTGVLAGPPGPEALLGLV
jgi:hypothetical protein